MADLKSFLLRIKKHKRIAIDTSLFIYAFEENSTFSPFSKELFNICSQNDSYTLITSAITVSEVLVKPFEKNATSVAELYGQLFLTMPGLKIVDIDYTVAKLAAIFRAKYSLSLPDMIHISTAIVQKTDLFITNDQSLKKIKELDICYLGDYI